MLKPKVLIRIASGCMLFFALGHSAGHFTRYDVKDSKAQEVLNAMISNKFDMFGQMRSYDQNYTGMSLNLIFTLITFTILLWIISNIASDNKKLAIQLLIPITLCMIGFAITGFLYFFPVPAVTCLVASILTTTAIVKLKKT